MAVSVGSSSIVTDGLVLYLDPSVSTNYVLTEVEVLVVAGGGSGGTGSNGGGGGGAGGLIYRSSYPVLTGVGITVVIGNGGSSTVGRGVGSNGQNSIFGNITATGGGGGGGSGGSSAGLSGGSGGGGMYPAVGGSGATGQGNTGGTGNYALNGPHDAGGGGGGASQRGEDANEDYAGRGGNGLCFSLTGTPRYYAGGGGGGSNGISGGGLRRAGAGGLGGGGRGGVNGVTLIGQSGEANTGGGGGGGVGASGGASGAGGSGIVIVRYPGPQKATGGNIITQVSGYTVHVFTGSGTFTPTATPINGGVISGLQDLSGNLNTGIQFGGITYNTNNGGFVVLDGIDDWISTNFNPNLDNNRLYTYEIWFRDDIAGGFSDNNALISNYGPTGTSPFSSLHSLADGFVRIDERNSSNSRSTLVSNISIVDNTWKHIVATASSTELSLYINGVSAGTPVARPGGVITSGQNFVIGGNHLGRYQSCNISIVRIYLDKAFTASEVVQNFNAQRRRFGV